MTLLRVLALLLAMLTGVAYAVSEADLLEPDKAFRMTTRALDERTVEISFAIADGYYLYRDRFQFEAEPGFAGAAFKLGAPQFPPGVRKKDEFFGEVETYRKQVAVRIPVEKLGTGETLKLAVTSQGCADVGVCYVPLQTRVSV
jgi:thioredoxin:protein disulfide reductase